MLATISVFMLATIAIESPRQAEIDALLRLSAEYAQSLYPPESNILLSVAEPTRPHRGGRGGL
jgi:putative acetyltransferase